MAGAAGSALGATLGAGAGGAVVVAGVCGVAFGSSLFCPQPTAKIAVNMTNAIQILAVFMASAVLLCWCVVCARQYTP